MAAKKPLNGKNNEWTTFWRKKIESFLPNLELGTRPHPPLTDSLNITFKLS
jgi:hypothetical protein